MAWPSQARVETWVEAGTEVTPFYDPMLAKIIVRRRGSRRGARESARGAEAAARMAGIETNLSYLRQVTADPGFEAGGITTSFLESFRVSAQRHRCDRTGHADDGAGLSGTARAIGMWVCRRRARWMRWRFRIANRLVGNLDSGAGLEIAVTGPTLRFASDTVIALTGADFGARLNGTRVPLWRSIQVPAGSMLEMDDVARGREPRVSGGLRRHRCAGVSGQPEHFHPGRIRRPCGPRAARRRRAANRGGRTAVSVARGSAAELVAAIRAASGRSGCCTGRTARPISSRRKTSRCSSRRPGRCITIRTARAFG